MDTGQIHQIAQALEAALALHREVQTAESASALESAIDSADAAQDEIADADTSGEAAIRLVFAIGEAESVLEYGV